MDINLTVTVDVPEDVSIDEVERHLTDLLFAEQYDALVDVTAVDFE